MCVCVQGGEDEKSLLVPACLCVCVRVCVCAKSSCSHLLLLLKLLKYIFVGNDFRMIKGLNVEIMRSQECCTHKQTQAAFHTHTTNTMSSCLHCSAFHLLRYISCVPHCIFCLSSVCQASSSQPLFSPLVTA